MSDVNVLCPIAALLKLAVPANSSSTFTSTLLVGKIAFVLTF